MVAWRAAISDCKSCTNASLCDPGSVMPFRVGSTWQMAVDGGKDLWDGVGKNAPEEGFRANKKPAARRKLFDNIFHTNNPPT
mmetsp:Transcript_13170/g.25293  ORF Transcript_13170/g.25293 Transcript_13170/m.25293 type:complete len:82 (-) Transcript_13170:84-329(-)